MTLDIGFNLDSWTGGIMDGEGTISITVTLRKDGKKKYDLIISVGNTNPKMIEVLHGNYSGKVTTEEAKGNASKFYKWTLHGWNAKGFLEIMRGHVVCKREQVEIALAYINTIKVRGVDVLEEDLQKREDLRNSLVQLHNNRRL